MKKTAQSKAVLNARRKQDLRDAGLIRKEVWVKPSDVDAVMDFDRRYIVERKRRD